MYIFLLSFKEHFLNVTYVPFTELSPGGLMIYLVGACDRAEEMHGIKILAVDQGWATAVRTGCVNTLGRQGVSERS